MEQTTEPTQDLRGRFSCKPRCCDWCEHRGTKQNPLHRLFVESDRLTPGKPDQFFWWVHQPCAEMILEDETISAWWNYGPYPLMETT